MSLVSMLLLVLMMRTVSAFQAGNPQVGGFASSFALVEDAVFREFAPPSPWAIVEHSHPATQIELLFAVRQQNIEILHEVLMNVSTPHHDKYGKHLSNQALHTLIAPKVKDINAVLEYLDAQGIFNVTKLSPNGDLIQATTTIGKAEMLLGGVKYVRLRHQQSGATAHRLLSSYSLPTEVAQAVDFVSPTTHLPASRTPRVQAAGGAGEAGFPGRSNVPKTLRTLYSVGDAVGKAPANKQAVTAFLGQHYSHDALQKFWDRYCSPEGLVCGKGLPKLVGDATSGTPGVEGMLDIESMTGVAGNVESEYWGFAGRSPDDPANEPFMKWLGLLSSTSDELVPKLFSTSYGEDEGSWSKPAAQRLNVEFIKAGVRGISLLFAAGDEGANCKGGRFVAEGPGSSPYVTAVGGTTPAQGYPQPGSESAVGLSSGGFSSYWPQPKWQADAVSSYLSNTSGLPSASHGYNVSGRAYPDIAAQATDFCVTPFGCSVAGTSCASPTAAAVFSLVNDMRLQAGKSPLGFLNPFIYANPKAFNDITTGSSDGCGLFGRGWPAAPGWDAVTGVGTPNYMKLAAAALQLA